MAEYLEMARESEPFDPSLYEPLDEEEEADIDNEEGEDLRRMTFDARLKIYSWWNRQDRGSWGRRIADDGTRSDCNAEMIPSLTVLQRNG